VAREWNDCSTAFWTKLLPEDEDDIFVTVLFFDSEGDELLWVNEWLRPETRALWWDLKTIEDLGVGFPSGYCGSLEITTHEDVDYPSGPPYKPIRVEVMTACDCP
jgi:hypothetical protein